MTNWRFTINVVDLWKKASDREIDVKEFKTKLHEILSTYTQTIKALSLDAIECFSDLLSELDDVEFKDYNELDVWMCEFYNFCDDYRIWFKTF